MLSTAVPCCTEVRCDGVVHLVHVLGLQCCKPRVFIVATAAAAATIATAAAAYPSASVTVAPGTRRMAPVNTACRQVVALPYGCVPSCSLGTWRHTCGLARCWLLLLLLLPLRQLRNARRRQGGLKGSIMV